MILELNCYAFRILCLQFAVFDKSPRDNSLTISDAVRDYNIIFCSGKYDLIRI